MLYLQGFLEQTYLFYGFYKVDKIDFPKVTYNLALAYFLVTIAYLFLSMIWIVKRYLQKKEQLLRYYINVQHSLVNICLFLKVCCRIQAQPGPGWGSLSKLLQQDLCRLGFLHLQHEHSKAKETQFALWAQGQLSYKYLDVEFKSIKVPFF